MGWVYLDDHFDEHPKVLEAREIHRDAPWLFVAGLCYVRRSASSGLIVGPQIPRLITRYQPKAKEALLEASLWDDVGAGSVEIHDYHEWNRTNEERSASARNAAQVKWGRDRSQDQRNRQTRSQRLAAAREIRRHTDGEWLVLVDACGSECLRCGTPFDDTNRPVKDHITPIYQGGGDGIDNLQPLCRRCNSQKGAEAVDYRPPGAVS